MEQQELIKLRNLIEEEVQLYSSLKDFFEEKRKILISNNVEELMQVDEKILNTIDELKSARNHRQIVCALLGNRDMSLSDMISLAKSTPDCEGLAQDFADMQTGVNTLIEEISQAEFVIKELLRHGMNLVNKTLNLISNAASVSGDYNRTGHNVPSSIDRISSVVEEV